MTQIRMTFACVVVFVVISDGAQVQGQTVIDSVEQWLKIHGEQRPGQAFDVENSNGVSEFKLRLNDSIADLDQSIVVNSGGDVVLKSKAQRKPIHIHRRSRRILILIESILCVLTLNCKAEKLLH